MRSRMKVVRLNREKKLKNDAWAKWRQLYQSRLSAQHYSKHLLARFFSQWRGRLAGVDAVEDVGETLVQVHDSRRVSKFWHIWRRASALRATEGIFAERVVLRVMSDVMVVWRSRMCVLSVPGFIWLTLVLHSSPGAISLSQKNSIADSSNGGRSVPGRQSGAGYVYVFYACRPL